VSATGTAGSPVGSAFRLANQSTAISLTPAPAPGTATQLVASHRAARTNATAAHPARTVLPPPSVNPAAAVLHFISVIPTAVWIALAVAIGLAAIGGGAAFALGRRASRTARQVAAVTAVAATDQLTGLLNRRGFTESAERELERARRYGHPLALAYLDIRGLKAVNDSEGHRAGDQLLAEVAGIVSRSARSHDVVGRVGGDELAVLLAEQAGPGAAALGRRVRDQIPSRRDALGLRQYWDVTVGTASFPYDGDTLEELLAAADRRMYEERGIELRGH
jgi:diguanylate cyclase (GGDEF)-like protein